MMGNSLQPLFQAIAQARDEAELQNVMPQVGAYFAARRWKLFLFDRLPDDETQLAGVLKLALSVEYNPVLRYLVERHTPVHEGMVVSPRAWKLICPRADHWHAMLGPIVSNSHLIGSIGLTRDRDRPAFDAQDLADLSALCLHLSTRLTALLTQLTRSQALKSERLTAREIQIAELVAQGLTNAEIGAAIWITENSVKQALKRIFRKLEVSSRAEMVAQLSFH